MFCRNCGKGIPEEVKFCPHCGGVVGNCITPQMGNTEKTGKKSNGKSLLSGLVCGILVLGVVAIVVFFSGREDTDKVNKNTSKADSEVLEGNNSLDEAEPITEDAENYVGIPGSNTPKDTDIGDEYVDEEINIEEPSEEGNSAVCSKTELVQYLNTNIFDFVDMIGDMYDVGATDGSVEYRNETIIASAGYDSNDIQFISIEGECNYSIRGITYGMLLTDAIKIATEGGGQILNNTPRLKVFLLKDGSSLNIYTEDGSIVNGISLFSNQ